MSVSDAPPGEPSVDERRGAKLSGRSPLAAALGAMAPPLDLRILGRTLLHTDRGRTRRRPARRGLLRGARVHAELPARAHRGLHTLARARRADLRRAVEADSEAGSDPDPARGGCVAGGPPVHACARNARRRRRRHDPRLSPPRRRGAQAGHLDQGAGVDPDSRQRWLGWPRGSDHADGRRARLLGRADVEGQRARAADPDAGGRRRGHGRRLPDAAGRGAARGRGPIPRRFRGGSAGSGRSRERDLLLRRDLDLRRVYSVRARDSLSVRSQASAPVRAAGRAGGSRRLAVSEHAAWGSESVRPAAAADVGAPGDRRARLERGRRSADPSGRRSRRQPRTRARHLGRRVRGCPDRDHRDRLVADWMAWR